MPTSVRPFISICTTVIIHFSFFLPFSHQLSSLALLPDEGCGAYLIDTTIKHYLVGIMLAIIICARGIVPYQQISSDCFHRKSLANIVELIRDLSYCFSFVSKLTANTFLISKTPCFHFLGEVPNAHPFPKERHPYPSGLSQHNAGVACHIR